MSARIFPDPSSEPEFIADNGIRYKWSDEKSRWEVASSTLTNDETQAQIDTIKGDIITHHKIGWKSKKIFSRARMSGVIHARSDNMIQSLTKYQHFLFNSMQKNIFRSDQATVAGMC